ncbi:hypothetical protein VdG1_04520 [Verticillium dahliae VDG1]|nr:hypothetical protein VdG1_04520 [Verticillium dahliae VDG1]
MTLTLQSWLEDVNESGINLTSYGREELEIIKSTTSDREYQYGPLRLRPLDHDDCIPRVPKATDTTDCCRFPRLETFTYGPSPGDWTFTWDWGTEEFAGEFWAAIETPAISISGAWIEEQCYDYELYEDNFEKFLPEKEEDDPYVRHLPSHPHSPIHQPLVPPSSAQPC